MRSRLTSALTVLGAVALLVLVANGVSVAANGKPFLLGANNSATKTTKLTRTTNGAALNLSTKSNSAPLIVNGKATVKNLNADQVDGYSATDLRTTSRVYTRDITTPTSTFSMQSNPGTGTYLVSYSAYLQNGTGSNGVLNCYISTNVGGAKFVAQEVLRYSAGDPAGVSGAGLVTVNPFGSVTLRCSNTNSFTTYGGQPIQLVLTKTAVGYSGTLRHATFRTGVKSTKQ